MTEDFLKGFVDFLYYLESQVIHIIRFNTLCCIFIREWGLIKRFGAQKIWEMILKYVETSTFKTAIKAPR